MNSSIITVSSSGRNIFISHLSQALLNKRIKEAPKHLLQPNYFGSVEPCGEYRIKRTPCWQQLFSIHVEASLYREKTTAEY